MAKSRVLFLCTGNSCRSQMAQGLVNHYLSKEWRAYSAGTQPAGYVHPLAIRAMAELNIDISGNLSNSVDSFREMELDLVVTVCDGAAEECPVWLGEGKVVHISFPDPAEASGTDEQKMETFRAVRDDIRRRVFSHLSGGNVLIQDYH